MILAIASAGGAGATIAARGTRRVVALVERRWGADGNADVAALLPDLRCLLAIIAEREDIVSNVGGDMDQVNHVPGI
jgi:hypothetical protein